jgi:hypothetical protein
MEIKNLTIILFVISIGCGICNGAKAENDPYPMFEFPVVSSGYDIKGFINKPKGTKSTNYILKVKYPAPEVLDFYNTRFKEMGYTPSFNGRFGDREWECFIDGTKKGNPRVRQLLALWINPELHTEVVLALIYEKTGKNWGDELHVLCQIQPTIDTGRLENFFDQLNTSKQNATFMKLLDLYRMPNGEINIDKAISENPDNDYLKEYKIIIDEMKRERDFLIRDDGK